MTSVDGVADYADLVQKYPAAQAPEGAGRPVVAQYFPCAHGLQSELLFPFVRSKYVPAGQGAFVEDPAIQ